MICLRLDPVRGSLEVTAGPMTAYGGIHVSPWTRITGSRSYGAEYRTAGRSGLDLADERAYVPAIDSDQATYDGRPPEAEEE